jgi:ubiquitin-activating enzyme E1
MPLASEVLPCFLSSSTVLTSLPPVSPLSASLLPPTHSSSSSSSSLKTIEFDKDIDPHMMVIAAMGNLRARNYSIPEADLHTARGIAGKIIPAIATTTAMVTGFICLELIKILQKKPLPALLNTSCNLALPVFLCNEPQPPETRLTTINGKEYRWNQWDRIDIQDTEMTLTGLMTHLREHYHVQLIMLSYGVSILFSDYMNKKKMLERLDMPLQEIVKQVAKREFNPKQKYIILEIITNDLESEEEVDLPYLRFRLFK